MHRTEYLIGIDEAGRGPLAGPVAVGIVAVPIEFDQSLLKDIRDSKQLSEPRRLLWRSVAEKAERAGSMHTAVVLTPASVIDAKGIVYAIQKAMRLGLQKISLDPDKCAVLLDGALHAPTEYRRQQTIIKGDEIEPIISFASILAKVTRDAHMTRLAKRYPRYGFDLHKGYGTAFHREQIKKYGLSGVHRRSFCKALAQSMD